MKTDLLQGFYLGDHLVDPREGQVIGTSGSAHLPPKAMEVLLCLAEKPGELVTREALLTAVWGAGHGSHEALSHAVSEIRHALDDHYEHAVFVQTLPRRGYRLLVDVRPASSPAGSENHLYRSQALTQKTGLFENLKQRGVLETAIAYLVIGWLLIQVVDIVFDQLLVPAWAGTFVTALVIAGFPIAVLLSWFLEYRDGRAIPHELSPKDATRRRFNRTNLAVIGAFGIAAVAVFVYDRSVGLPTATNDQAYASSNLPPILENTIAVLPFVNVDGSEDTQVFANGLVDDVITRLSLVPGLLVSSRGDSFTLEPNSPSRKVRERLRVARYLEGSVQLADDQMRIIVQLINSETGFHVFSRRFDRSVEDFFDVRDELTELTVANVRVTLSPETQAASVVSADDPRLDAYVLYRRGVEQSYRPKTISTVEAALQWFNAALDSDPDYAAAHAGRCAAFVDAYTIVADAGYIEKAHVACATALTLNPNLDVVHTALGNLYLATGEYANAENAYLKALEIVPNSVEALTGLGSTYLRQQKPAAAEESFRRAVGLHPGDWSAYNRLGTFLFRSGRYAEAVAEYERVVGLDDANMNGYSNLGAANMLAGNFSAAVLALKKSIELEPDASTYSNLGLMYYYLGRLDEAIESHKKAIELTPNNHLRWSNLGDALWIAGQKDEAREAFAKAELLARNALKVNPNDPNGQMDLAWISAMLDDFDAASDYIDRARRQAPDDPYVHYIDGLILLRNGQTELALAALEDAANMGYSTKMMAAEPHLASIRGNPRFRAIVDGAQANL